MVFTKYSVLMSVYYKESPEFLKDSLRSMLYQTKVPNEIVLVKDGPLTVELEEVLNVFKDMSIVKIISLEKNVGLGKALNIGLTHCSNELVARMDTDDISRLDRCERQIELFNQSENSISVIGSTIEEFINSPNNVVAIKPAIEGYDNIKKQMKYRNPMAHPSVMFKKSHVISAGSYKDWFLNEDYYLWIRMMQKDFKFENISLPLVKMRITNDTYLRRGGWKYFFTQKKLFKYMLDNGILNKKEYLYNNLIRFVSRILITNKMRKYLYLKVLRKKISY